MKKEFTIKFEDDLGDLAQIGVLGESAGSNKPTRPYWLKDEHVKLLSSSLKINRTQGGISGGDLKIDYYTVPSDHSAGFLNKDNTPTVGTKIGSATIPIAKDLGYYVNSTDELNITVDGNCFIVAIATVDGGLLIEQITIDISYISIADESVLPLNSALDISGFVWAPGVDYRYELPVDGAKVDATVVVSPGADLANGLDMSGTSYNYYGLVATDGIVSVGIRASAFTTIPENKLLNITVFNKI